MSSVTLRHLTKKFGDILAVNDLNLDIQDGEFMVMLGPSGCGKTTALRCIAGLEQPTSGDILIGTDRVNDREPKDRDVAMVFQNYALYPHMRVYDNIAYPLRMLKLSRQELDQRVRKAGDLLQIGTLLNRMPRELSGGEQQRVALGRAMVREPRVFLMDEPLSNLDARPRLYMRSEIKALQKQLGVTMIYVTHDQAEAMTMADRIAVMEKSILQQVGTPDAIYFSPTTSFVASFIGSPPMNFLECTYQDGCLSGEGFNLSAQPWSHTLGAGPRQLALGIRPEDISLSLAPVEGAFPVQVYISEPLGAEVIVNVKVGKTIVKVRTAPDVKPGPGTAVWIAFNSAKVHLFRPDNRQVIWRDERV